MNEFVKYLNGLHNYYAQNQNAYGERNVESPFYAKTMVPIRVCDYIISSINNIEPHIIILTGHAGDGKTSIMFQVIDRLGAKADSLEPIQEIVTESGRSICCIKDFSELSDSRKKETLQNAISLLAQGKYVFMVANTGPLINTFGSMFSEKKESDAAKMALIEAMDSNDGEIKELFGYRMAVINVAAIENTGFAKQYLTKIISPELWESCQNCSKREYCHILRNKNLLEINRDRAMEFIEFFYIWQTEYGTRLTIRSMTEQLAYMMTGGDDCDSVCPAMPHEKLFPNLFFGYEGIVSNPLADNILAVKSAKNSAIFLKRMRADEELLIRRNYKELFGSAVNKIIEETNDHTKLYKGFDEELRRIYLFLNIVSEEQHTKDLEDIFSKQFIPYLNVRNEEKKPTKSQKSLVIDALRMIYQGTVINSTNMIPITMSTEGGITQNVQLIAGVLNTGDIELGAEEDSVLNKDRKNLILKIKKKKECLLTLPMVDHFEELKNGVIDTSMDPQLSYGIENLKSRLLELADMDDDKLDLLVMDNKGFTQKSIIIEDGKIFLQ